MFDLQRLIKDVFDPAPDERVLILTDRPRESQSDTPQWAERREMAAEWHAGFQRYGAQMLPLLTFRATGANNADLPEFAYDENNQQVHLEDYVAQADLVVALTRYSATAPLASRARRTGTLRVASMPGVLRSMEQTALAADYCKVGRLADLLAEKLTAATAADAVFTTGHQLHFDLRFRTGEADNGRCHRSQTPHLINLPSGEGFIVPYEGEKDGIPSETAGEIPVALEEETVILHVKNNRIHTIAGISPDAAGLRDVFDGDPARCNIAELGLGCNDKAVVTGCVLEDEKAGFHWAYGRSEHLGGCNGPDAFIAPETVLHNDIVYAHDCPIGIQTLTLHYPDRPSEVIMQDSRYTADIED